MIEGTLASAGRLDILAQQCRHSSTSRSLARLPDGKMGLRLRQSNLSSAFENQPSALTFEAFCKQMG